MQGELHPSPPYRNIYSFTDECAKAWILIPANFLSDRSTNSLQFALMEICLYATQSGTNGKIEPLTDILGNKVVKVFSNPSFRKIGNSEMPGNFRRNKPIIQKKFVFWVKRQRSINSS